MILQLISTSLLFAAGTTDPGIIPATYFSPIVKRDFPRRYTSIRKKEQRIFYWVNDGAHLTRLKYCETCCIFRPKKSAHCNACNNCVSKFDHHCMWMGTCVGGRNYSLFMWLCISLSTSALYCFIVSIIRLVLNYQNRKDN